MMETIKAGDLVITRERVGFSRITLEGHTDSYIKHSMEVKVPSPIYENKIYKGWFVFSDEAFNYHLDWLTKDFTPPYKWSWLTELGW